VGRGHGTTLTCAGAYVEDDDVASLGGAATADIVRRSHECLSAQSRHRLPHQQSVGIPEEEVREPRLYPERPLGEPPNPLRSVTQSRWQAGHRDR